MNIRQHTLKAFKVVALAIAGTTTLFSCHKAESIPEVILAGEITALCADSLIIAGTPAIPDGLPAFTSSVPIIDAAFAKGMAVCHNILSDSSQPHLIDCLELFSLLKPEYCRKKLSALTHDSIVTGKSPAYTGRGIWIMAATETALASGSQEWTEYAATVGERTLGMEKAVAFSEREGLFQGIPSTRLGSDEYLPRWMNEVERYETMTLMSNVITTGAYRALARIHTHRQQSELWQTRANTLAHKINTRMWQPDAGMYNRFLYTGAFPLPAPMTDNASQPLAILCDVAIPEMADKILASTPWYSYGMPLFYPSPAGSPLMNASLAYPRVQGLWALAAAKRGNETVLRAALSALLTQSFGDGCDTVAQTQVSMCVLRIFAGIRLAADGMEFAPTVPEFLKAGFMLKGIRYRNTELTLRIKGSGNRITRFAIDGKVQQMHRIDASLSGKHTVTITLADNKLTNHALPTHEQIWAPPVPEIEALSPRILRIDAPAGDVKYHMYINGTLHSVIDSAGFHIPDIEEFAEICVIPVTKNKIRGFSSKPYLYSPPGSIRTLQAEDFAPGGTSYIRGWRPAFRYVESTPRTNSAIDFVCEIPDSARYIARVCYANGNGAVEAGDACAIRTVNVNGNPAGTFILPARGDGWWLSSAFSNSLILTLAKGENHITVSYDPGIYPASSSHDVLIDYLRLIRIGKEN
ncbi:MAG: hypothetical protein K2H84_05370 [Paramuribaculum sp.]|nr:hypothetical protein [Paramuribaculum sp.]